MTPRDTLRIGDAEREQALSALGEHFAQGRLSRDEHDERCDAVWTARTGADLAALFTDLPGGAPGAAAPAPALAPARRGWLPPVGLLVLGAVLLLVSGGRALPLVVLLGVVWFVLSRRLGVARPPWAAYERGRCGG